MARRKSAPKTMTDQDRLAKNERIKATAISTRKRRSGMDCKVYSVKVSKSRLTGVQKEALTRLFLEAKWTRNALLSSGVFTREDLKNFSDEVPVHTPNGTDIREIRVLGGQIAQGVLAELKTNLRQLSSLKKAGHKVGRLNFCKEITSIDFVQYGNSWKLNAEKHKIKLANIPGWIKVHGLNQLPEGAECANAKLVKKASGYYIQITTYIPKVIKATESGTAVGIDMGVKTGLTLSDGTKINTVFEEPERLKRLRKKLSRQQKGSNKYQKTWELINKELEKLTNKKNDAANKVVCQLAKNETIYFQDENISGWKNKKSIARGSKKIHHGILGRVKSRLQKLDNSVCLDRFLPTTQLCVCGLKNPHSLDKRIYSCTSCGYTEDRDVHAAMNMIRIGRFLEENNSTDLGQIRTPVEFPVRPAEMSFYGMETGTETMKQEAAMSLASP